MCLKAIHTNLPWVQTIFFYIIYTPLGKVCQATNQFKPDYMIGTHLWFTM